MDQDSYRTLAAASEATVRERGSRFLAFAWPVASEQEIRERLDGALVHALVNNAAISPKAAGGRRLAEERHAFMEDFVARFLGEWAGEQ